MKMPNGYGSVVNLGKNRRKPFAVRITVGVVTKDGVTRQKYKYLEYFEKSKDAHMYLAQYNSGQQIKEHVSLIKQPTFKELFDEWIEYKEGLNKAPSASTLRNYKLVPGWCSDISDKKFNSIKVADLQNVVRQYKDKSLATIMTIKTVLSQMYQYALKREYVEKNYALLIDFEYSKSEDEAHTAFTSEEIQLLWDNINVIENVDLILMMIYTGFRASEFIALENKNVHISERYVIGGMKTEAGKDRIVPLNKKIIPLFEKYYSEDRKYLVPNSKGTKYTYGVFNISVWTPAINKIRMDHKPHDTRHTLTTLLDRAGANKVSIKRILGHSIQDITDGIYIHKNLDDLLEAIDLI